MNLGKKYFDDLMEEPPADNAYDDDILHNELEKAFEAIPDWSTGDLSKDQIDFYEFVKAEVFRTSPPAGGSVGLMAEITDFIKKINVLYQDTNLKFIIRLPEMCTKINHTRRSGLGDDKCVLSDKVLPHSSLAYFTSTLSNGSITKAVPVNEKYLDLILALFFIGKFKELFVLRFSRNPHFDLEDAAPLFHLLDRCKKYLSYHLLSEQQ